MAILRTYMSSPKVFILDNDTWIGVRPIEQTSGPRCVVEILWNNDHLVDRVGKRITVSPEVPARKTLTVDHVLGHDLQ